MSKIKGYILASDSRVLCRVSNLLVLLPFDSSLRTEEVCFTWKDNREEAIQMILRDDFSGNPSLDSCVDLRKLELLEAEVDTETNTISIL